MQKKRIYFFVFATIVVLSAAFIVTNILEKPRCATRGSLPKKVEEQLKIPAVAPEVTQPKKQRPAPTEQEPPLGNEPLLN